MKVNFVSVVNVFRSDFVLSNSRALTAARQDLGIAQCVQYSEYVRLFNDTVGSSCCIA